MSMRDSNDRLTICEVLRCINDRLQTNHCIEVNHIRDMLALAEQMAKKMAKKLQEYNKNQDPNWWVKNNTVKQNFDRAMNKNYVVGDPNHGSELLQK